MGKVWIISQIFYPDEISTGYVITRIADRLAKDGQIHVICGSAQYQSAALSSKREINKNIIINRVTTPSWNKNNLFIRIILFLYFTIRVSFIVIARIKRSDKVILVTNPPTLLTTVSFLKFFIRFRLYIILQDIFPENAAVSGLIKGNSALYKFMLNIFKVAYRQANHLIACGSDMAVLFEKKGIERSRISVITNWADHEEVFPDNLINANRNIYFNVDLNNKIVIEFAGNIGRVQGLDSFVALFLKVNNPCLRLVIIGNGAFKDKVKNLAQKNGAINKSILFFESKPRSEQVIFLNSCDIGLVTLCEGMYGLGVPSKIYNIMAAGKPVLYIGDAGSEIFEYVKKQDIGWGFSWDESEKIIHFLKTLNIAKYGEICEKGSKARAFVECEYTEEKIIDKYVSIVNH